MAHRSTLGSWLPIATLLVALTFLELITASGDLQTANSNHINDFADDNPLNKIRQKVENMTNLEDRERTYIFNKNGEVFHEYVEDHRDIHKGRMEQLIEAWQAMQQLAQGEWKGIQNSTGSISDMLDPGLESEINYKNLVDDIKNELGNETFYDPDKEASENNVNITIRDKRTMEKYEPRRWPKAIVPYVIKPEVEQHTNEYERAMGVYEEKTCVRFIPWVNASTNEDHDLGHPGHVNFVSASGCWSYQGNMRWSGGQSLSCCGGTTCVHELGHVMGSAHEHQSYERDGWIRVNPQNIMPDSRQWYNEFGENSMLTYGYDLSSTMHYPTWGFSSGGPTMTMLYPELYVGDSDYYMFMEIVDTHKCAEMEPCVDFQLTCENDGYVSIVRGKCACRCPTGLDPETGCTSPIRAAAGLKMPSGQYALPQLKTGCPGNGDFKEGEVTHYGDGGNYQSNPFSLAGTFSGSKAVHAFCTRDEGSFETDPEFPETNDWPGGSYCILKTGGECPRGMIPGYIHYTDVENEESSSSGTLPDGVFTNNATRMEFCCQYNGFTFNPISLPVEKPFVLFTAGHCQEVIGMHSRKEHYSFNAVDVEFEGVFSQWHRQWDDTLYSYYCVYEPADMDCGDVITLDSSNPTTFIEINSAGRTDMECTWVVKGDNQDGTLVLEFDEFDIRKNGDSCVDTVEVRHARIGQKGLIYCGQNDQQSIRSITDKMMIRFSTKGADSTSALKAYVRWIPNSELCYDVTDGGETYSGKVNYTRKFEPCLPWAEVTECPHHPWQAGDEQDNLEGNYCRNPDDSHRPWCYTSLSGCQRNYCDVCSLEEPFDREENCEELRKQGLCTNDVAQATHKCACACNDLLPNLDPVQKFTDIRCQPPTAPIDGVLVGELKEDYSLGEQVSYTCQGRDDVFHKTCLSAGDWTPLGLVCVECPPGSVVYNDSCHFLLDGHFSYPDAKEICEGKGGHVALVQSAEEFLQVLAVAAGNEIWLGLTDIETEGTFVWDDGTPQDYSNWNDGEPNDWGWGEDCGVMQGGGYWNDIPCSLTRATVCTVPRIKEFPCVNSLEDQCYNLLEANPTMCVNYPSFAEQFCSKTCGICGAEGITCNASPASLNVNVTSDVISVGQFADYTCHGNTYFKSGSQFRACKKDGTLTGEEYVCQGASESTIKIGSPSLEKAPELIPDYIAFTGENDLWTITHKGLVTAWEYYSNSPMETAFMVWRVEESGTRYKLIGKNVIQTGNDDMERYEVPVTDRIVVEKGDLIGIWNGGDGGVHFTECDGALNPGMVKVSWSKPTDHVENFVVGNVESFSNDNGCARFAFRAEVSLLQ